MVADQVNRALALYRGGMGYRAVAKRLGLSESGVYRAVRVGGLMRRRGRPKGEGGSTPRVPETPEEAAMRRDTLRQIAAWDRRRDVALQEYRP